MHGGEAAAAVWERLPGPALLHQAELRAEHVACGDRAEADDDVGTDAREIAFQPEPARALLGRIRAAVQARLAAALELEMLDRIGDVDAAAVDAEFLQRAVEQLAGGTDEGMAAEVFLVAGLLADDEDARVVGAFAEHGLGRRLPQRAALAAGCGVAQRVQAVVEGFRRAAFGDAASGGTLADRALADGHRVIFRASRWMALEGVPRSAQPRRVARVERPAGRLRIRFAQQHAPHFALVGGIERGQHRHLPSHQGGQRQAIAIHDPRALLARHLVAGQHGADQVERVDRRQGQQRTVVRAPAYRAQRADGFGQGELLARQAGDEATATDLAAGFEAVIDAQQLAPRRQPAGFALEQTPADDAVTPQEGAGDVLGGFRRDRGGGAAPRQRPAPRVLDPEQRGAAAAAIERMR